MLLTQKFLTFRKCEAADALVPIGVPHLHTVAGVPDHETRPPMTDSLVWSLGREPHERLGNIKISVADSHNP